ncbi:hypothetical protein ED096_25410 [Escherichia coli]|nr:hypothetical protein [Escherichia coli]MFB03077.1 hypothetical protein [Escherichia coli]
MTDFGGKTSIFSHPVYLFLRKFSLQDSRGGSPSIFIWLCISSDNLAGCYSSGVSPDLRRCDNASCM